MDVILVLVYAVVLVLALVMWVWCSLDFMIELLDKLRYHLVVDKGFSLVYTYSVMFIVTLLSLVLIVSPLALLYWATTS